MGLAQIIINLLIIALIIYLIWYFFFNPHNTLHVCQDGTKSKRIAADKLSGDKGTSNFTWSMWFYVSDWSYRIGEEKVLLTRNNASNSLSAGGGSGGSPEISLDKHENNMTVKVKTMKNGQNDTGNQIPTPCVVNNVPLQRWVNAIISLNNRTMDVYVQGKLVRTCILPGVVDVNGNSATTITPDGGFKGFTSNVQYFDHPLNPQEAYNIYAKGPNCGGGSWFDKYQIKLSYLVNNQEEGYVII